MSKPRTLADIVKKRPSSSSDPPVDDSEKFKKTNDSLVMKIMQMKSELSMSRKLIEKLRKENVELQERNQELSVATDDEKIEILVAQRVKSKLQGMLALNEKLVNVLQNTATQYKAEISELREEVPPSIANVKPRRELAVLPGLDNISEDPIAAEPATSHAEPSSRVRPRSAVRKGRRSDFVNPDQVVLEPYEFVAPAPVSARRSKGGKDAKENTNTKRVGATETPKFVPKQRVPLAVSAATLTPMCGQPTDSVRRKRAAAVKIGSMKEPSTNTKLRNPGKYNEPSPFVDNFFV